MAKEKFARFDNNNVVQDILIIDSNDYIGNTEEDGAQRCAHLRVFLLPILKNVITVTKQF
jgi:hypothetical protein